MPSPRQYSPRLFPHIADPRNYRKRPGDLFGFFPGLPIDQKHSEPLEKVKQLMNQEYTPRRLGKRSPHQRPLEGSPEKGGMPSIARPRVPETTNSSRLSRNKESRTETTMRLTGMNNDGRESSHLLYKASEQVTPLRTRDENLGQSVQIGLDRALQKSKDMVNSRNKHNASQPLRHSSTG